MGPGIACTYGFPTVESTVRSARFGPEQKKIRPGPSARCFSQEIKATQVPRLGFHQCDADVFSIVLLASGGKSELALWRMKLLTVLLFLHISLTVSFELRMVEGHSVHRVATLHRLRLVGKQFTAWSPNGRFKEGAALINDQPFYRIEAVGKNLFAFFGDEKEEEKSTVVHVHFGMAGNWAVYDDPTSVPEPTTTNRLRLEHPQVVADLSAMTVQHGNMSLYHTKRKALGEDPLRSDADPQKLWKRVQASSKSIGALIMDQSYFTGPGNIYRCEILFKAGVHPERLGKDLSEYEFQSIWHHTVDLLRRGYETGSILTVDREEAKRLGKPKLRRYIYNTSKCPRCGSSIQSWPINNRTCYACFTCQPMNGSEQKATATPSTTDCVPFNSHCARETPEIRLRESGPERLTVSELKRELGKARIVFPSGAKKAELVRLFLDNNKEDNPVLVSPEAKVTGRADESLDTECVAETTDTTRLDASGLGRLTVPELKTELMKARIFFHSGARKAELVRLLLEEKDRKPVFVSPEAAALEKAIAGESLAVEHIAELAPGQARKARARVLNFQVEGVTVTPDPSPSSSEDVSSRKRRIRTVTQNTRKTRSRRKGSEE